MFARTRIWHCFSRPGILVLVNDTDWELEGEGDYVLQNGDEIVFISTLHGGWDFLLSWLDQFQKCSEISQQWRHWLLITAPSVPRLLCLTTMEPIPVDVNNPAVKEYLALTRFVLPEVLSHFLMLKLWRTDCRCWLLSLSPSVLLLSLCALLQLFPPLVCIHIYPSIEHHWITMLKRRRITVETNCNITQYASNWNIYPSALYDATWLLPSPCPCHEKGDKESTYQGCGSLPRLLEFHCGDLGDHLGAFRIRNTESGTRR